MSSLNDIETLLKTNPDAIKLSLETSMKLQAAILKYVQESGKRVMCEMDECNSPNEVPKDLPIVPSTGEKVHYMKIQILNEDADDDYVNSIISRLKRFEDAYIHFDSLTAEAIIKIDEI